MGCDIHGAVEVKSPYSKDYDYVLNIKSLIGRDYDAYGLLFGVRNYANHEPIAEGRGLPDNISRQLKEDVEGWGIGHSKSWITLDEIRKIDLEKETIELDSRIHQYRMNQSGVLESFSKFSSGGDITNEDIERMRKGETIQKDNNYYRMEKLRVKDSLGKSWQALFKIMEVFAEIGHKPEDIRMVVFFDN